MIGFDGFLGGNLAIDDMPQHLDEGKGIFRKINFPSEEGYARTIRLCVRNQLEGVVGCAGAPSENPDDQLWIVTGQLGEGLRTIIGNL